MIISHKYKYIFLKTNKTAGTSIEIALSKFCGPDDIITTISPEDEITRTKLGYPGPQHFLQPIPRNTIKDILRSNFKGETLPSKKERKNRFYNHISAKLVKARIGNKVWNSYYKFCFERSPWDRVISQYFYRYRNQTESLPTVSEFVNSAAPLLLKERGYELYTIDREIAVDKVCKFEKLPEEIEVVRKQIGIPEKLELPRAKAGFRKDNRSYHEILGNDDKEKIANLFKEEIQLFGYSW